MKRNENESRKSQKESESFTEPLSIDCQAASEEGWCVKYFHSEIVRDGSICRSRLFHHIHHIHLDSSSKHVCEGQILDRSMPAQ